MRLRHFLVLTLIIALTVQFSSVVNAQDFMYFSDVPNTISYAQEVNYLAEMGIFSGDEAGKFNPDAIVTRAEMAAIICRVLGVENFAQRMISLEFTDVERTHWAHGYIAYARECNIVSGYGNGLYGPSDAVTYEQVVKMLMSAWDYDEQCINQGGYPDGYIKVANTLGVLTGIAERKEEGMTRKSVAILTYNLFQ